MMKLRYIVISVFVLLVMSCGNNKVNNNATVDADNSVDETENVKTDNLEAKTEMEKFIRDIYAKIIPEYNKAAHGGLPEGLDSLYEQFFSESNLKMSKVLDDIRDEHHADIIGFDCDRWICAQDWNHLDFEVRGSKVLRNGKGIVSVCVKDTFDDKEYVNIAYFLLVKEKGQWKIDDFLTEEDSKSGERRVFLEEVESVYNEEGIDLPDSLREIIIGK